MAYRAPGERQESCSTPDVCLFMRDSRTCNVHCMQLRSPPTLAPNHQRALRGCLHRAQRLQEKAGSVCCSFRSWEVRLCCGASVAMHALHAYGCTRENVSEINVAYRTVGRAEEEG
jgi:hypothetical protein